MALMKNGIPDNISKDCRVKINTEDDWLLRFGISPAANLMIPILSPSDKDMFMWIRENLKGYVHYVPYYHKGQPIIEFFFKRPADAIMFKMRFC